MNSHVRGFLALKPKDIKALMHACVNLETFFELVGDAPTHLVMNDQSTGGAFLMYRLHTYLCIAVRTTICDVMCMCLRTQMYTVREYRCMYEDSVMRYDTVL